MPVGSSCYFDEDCTQGTTSGSAGGSGTVNVVKCEATVSGGYKYVEEKRGEGQHGCMLYAVCGVLYAVCGVLCAVCVLRGTACSYRCVTLLLPLLLPLSSFLPPSLGTAGARRRRGGCHMRRAPCTRTASRTCATNRSKRTMQSGACPLSGPPRVCPAPTTR